MPWACIYNYASKAHIVPREDAVHIVAPAAASEGSLQSLLDKVHQTPASFHSNCVDTDGRELGRHQHAGMVAEASHSWHLGVDQNVVKFACGLQEQGRQPRRRIFGQPSSTHWPLCLNP